MELHIAPASMWETFHKAPSQPTMNAKSLSGTHTEQRCQGMALQGETEKAGRPGSCLTWRRPSSPACCWPGGGPRETSPPPAPSSYPAPACSWRGCGAAGPAWRRATSGQLVSAGSTLRCPPACTSSCQFTQVTNYSHQAGRWGGGWGGVGVGGGGQQASMAEGDIRAAHLCRFKSALS